MLLLRHDSRQVFLHFFFFYFSLDVDGIGAIMRKEMLRISIYESSLASFNVFP